MGHRSRGVRKLHMIREILTDATKLNPLDFLTNLFIRYRKSLFLKVSNQEPITLLFQTNEAEA